MILETTGAALLAAGAAVGLARSQYERGHFVTEEMVFYSPKIKKEGVFVFLSDLHDNEFGRDNRDLLREIERLKPDAILIGGDTMVIKPRKASLNNTENLLHGLSRFWCPIFYANGNHEQRMEKQRDTYGDMYREFKEMLEAYQVIYLQNKTVNWRDDISISGMDIGWKYYKDFRTPPMAPKYVERRLGQPDENRFQILMAHSPLFFDAYAGWGADLSLCGHFHGGTIRLPVLGGVMTPQYQFFKPCCAGTFEKNGRHMVVSRGLGTHSINIRIGNFPQLAVIRLKPGKGEDENGDFL